MGRPRTEPADRVCTAIRFGPELHARLLQAAEEREVSMSFLVVRAVADFLDRLIPVEEIRWVRSPAPTGPPDPRTPRRGASTTSEADL